MGGLSDLLFGTSSSMRANQSRPEPFDDFWYEGPGALDGRIPVGEMALRLSHVWAAVWILSSTIGRMPLHMYRKRADDGRDSASNHPLADLLRYQPNSWQTAYEFWSMAMGHVVLRGNFYAQILPGPRGAVDQLIPRHPDRMRIETIQTPQGMRLRYIWTAPDGKSVPLSQDEVMHLRGLTSDGIRGLSVLEHASSNFAAGLAMEKHSNKLFSQGARPPAVLQHPGILGEEAHKNLRQSIDAQIAGVENAGKYLILEEDMKWQQIGMTSSDAQYLECVVAGTLLTMANGSRRKAEDIRAGDAVVGWSNGPVIARVASVGKPPTKALIKIRTARGRELTTSWDHPFLAKRAIRTTGGRRDKSEAEWIQAGKLEVGNYVRVGLGMPVGATYEPMDRDQAYLLGAMIGNGCIRKSSFSFTTADDSVECAVRAAAQTMGGGLTPIPHSSYGFYLSTGGSGRNGSAIRSLMNESGAIGSRAETKRVPEAVMRGGPEAWSAFLSGYLDTDGCVGTIGGKCQPKAYWSSVSRELLDDCQHLLACLGVNSSIFAMDAGGKRMVVGQMCNALPSWGLFVTGAESLRQLSALLRPAHSRKSSRLAAMAELPATAYREHNWLFDRVTEVEFVGFGDTVGIEIEGVHTHVTAGLVTHNSREFSVYDAARWFNVPAHLLALAETPTYASIEAFDIGFVQHSIDPWAVNIEQVVRRDLITNTDYYAEFMREALIRGDIVSQNNALSVQRQNGIINADEWRSKINMNKRPGGDVYLEPMNMTRVGPDGNAIAAPGQGGGADFGGRAQQLAAASADRVLRREHGAVQKALRQHAGNPTAYRTWAQTFYIEHAGFVAEALAISEAAAVSYCTLRQTTSYLQTEITQADREALIALALAEPRAA